jgi:hypothetical protein
MSARANINLAVLLLLIGVLLTNKYLEYKDYQSTAPCSKYFTIVSRECKEESSNVPSHMILNCLHFNVQQHRPECNWYLMYQRYMFIYVISLLVTIVFNNVLVDHTKKE